MLVQALPNDPVEVVRSRTNESQTLTNFCEDITTVGANIVEGATIAMDEEGVTPVKPVQLTSPPHCAVRGCLGSKLILSLGVRVDELPIMMTKVVGLVHWQPVKGPTALEKLST